MLQRMFHLHQTSLDRLAELTGTEPSEIRRFRKELLESGFADTLLLRGAGLAFTEELPQGALLHLWVRAQRPDLVVETGVRPGYSTAWILSALEANGQGELVSIGPGSPRGRAPGIREMTVGQLVPPALRGRWTLMLGPHELRVSEVLARGGVDLFFSDNAPNPDLARFELRTAWVALSRRGFLMVHHTDSSPVWTEFCRGQGLPPQILDPGPPPLGVLAITHRDLAQVA